MACIHYWVFDPPIGRVSKGVCKYCGSEIEAVNYVEMGLFGHPMKKNQSKKEKQNPHASNGDDGGGMPELL
jgi:hypothetical protein